MIDIPCICKHEKMGHYKPPKATTYSSCWDCAFKGNWCAKYTPDNLSYVEQLAKEKNLI